MLFKMHSTVTVLLIAVLHIVEVDGKKLCHDLEAMKDLQSNGLNGEWYIVQVSNGGEDAKEASCVREVNEVDSCGNFISYFMMTEHGEDEPVGSAYKGYPIDGVRSRLSFIKDDAPDNVTVTTVIGTDYLNYAIWVSCTVENNIASNHVEVTSKYRELKPETLNHVKQLLREVNISDDLVAVNQMNCVDTELHLFPGDKSPLGA